MSTRAMSYESMQDTFLDAATGITLLWPIDRTLIEADPTDSLKTIGDDVAHRPDLLSVKYYGTTDLEWVIPMVNGMEDPVADLVPGLQVLVPLKSRVQEAMTTRELNR